MKLAYLDKVLPKTYTPIIADANRILEGYKRQGIDITLRGLYYRFIALDLLPDSWIDEEYNSKAGLPPNTKNIQKNYKRLGNIVCEARMAGLIDWDHLKDTGRNTDQNFHWDRHETETPGDILRGQGDAFYLDQWSNSPFHVEVMVEKDALEGTVKPIAGQYDCPFTSNRGYSSITAQRDSGLRIRRAQREGKQVIVLYVGDHDPSGIDMTRELEYKLALFSGNGITMKRLALNMDQIEQYGPPPNPAKLTDSRAGVYIEKFGDDSWEADALDALVLQGIVADAIRSYIDEGLLAVIHERQRQYADKMHRIAEIVDRAMEDNEE